MAKACQADDSLEKQFEALLKQQAGPELGVLVGKRAVGAKVLLYGTIKTPSPDGLPPITVLGGTAAAAPAAGKGAKKAAGGGRAAAAAATGSGLELEAEWISEHARQVARMLPGGLSVLGLYVFCPEPAATAAASQLTSLLASLAAVCPPSAAASSASSTTAGGGGGDVAADLLLLHVDSTSRKQTLRSLPIPAASASAAASTSGLRPCELRYAPSRGSLVLLRCWHGIDVALPVPPEGGGGGKGRGAAEGGSALRRQLAALVEAEAERIRSGIFASAGALPADSAPVGEALTPSATGDGLPLDIPTYDLTLLAPPPCQQLSTQPQQQQQQQSQQSQQPQAAGAAEARPVAGQARLRGALAGLALVNKREALGRATAELKADLVSSLRARLELLSEEAEREAELAQQQPPQQAADGTDGTGATAGTAATAAAHPLLCTPSRLAGSGGCALALPRRVLLPWLGGAVALCDYLLEGEPADAAAERARELLAMEAAQVVELEQAPEECSVAAGPWRPNALPGSAVAPGGKGGKAVGGAAAANHGSASSSTASGASGLPCSATVLVSMAVAALAAAVGLLSMSAQ